MPFLTGDDEGEAEDDSDPDEDEVEEEEDGDADSHSESDWLSSEDEDEECDEDDEEEESTWFGSESSNKLSNWSETMMNDTHFSKTRIPHLDEVDTDVANEAVTFDADTQSSVLMTPKLVIFDNDSLIPIFKADGVDNELEVFLVQVLG